MKEKNIQKFRAGSDVSELGVKCQSSHLGFQKQNYCILSLSFWILKVCCSQMHKYTLGQGDKNDF